MKLRQFSLFSIAAVCTVNCLFGQDEGSRQSARSAGERASASPLVTAIDQNEDGILDKDELKMAGAKLLAALDDNGDGKLSRNELRSSGATERQGIERSSRNRPGGDRRDRRRGRGGPRPTDIGVSPLNLGDPGIAWYGRLDTALKEAKRSNRPILFMAAASQCSGVPGVF